MTKRPHSVLASAGYQLMAPLLNNGKWNPKLEIRAQAKTYKNYISESYFELIARTGIENDKNNGNVIAEVEPQVMHAILNVIEGYALGRETLSHVAFNNYNFTFGRDKKRSETQRLVSRVIVGLRDGIINIAVIDALDDTRPKITFPFGFDTRPRGRYSLMLSTEGKEDRSVSSRTAALAYVQAVRDSLNEQMEAAQNRALRKAAGEGEEPSSNGRYTETTDAPSSSDDDLPF